MLNYLWLQCRKHNYKFNLIINPIFNQAPTINQLNLFWQSFCQWIGMENDLLFIKQQLAEKEKQVQEYQKQAQASGK